MLTTAYGGLVDIPRNSGDSLDHHSVTKNKKPLNSISGFLFCKQCLSRM
jgi:hypothetical protein